ncbi:MAG: B-box zinc finger protein, partial [Anaerolineales bacterium]|nr:B-box zinc finger protein [Anaerolineales bacterium]
EEETAVIQPTPQADTLELVCYRHPNRSTSLRCYTCGKPICSQCAIKTPVGYRCPDCIREAEDVFFNARPLDYLIAPLVSLPLSLLAGFLLLQVGGSFFFILLIFFIGGAVGSFIGRLAKAAVGRRRGRYLPHVVSATVILGGMVAAAPALIGLLLGNFSGIMGLLMPGIYVFIASSAAFYQMK